MLEFLRGLLGKLSGAWRRVFPQSKPQPVVRASRKKSPMVTHSFYHIGDLLDQLEGARRLLRKMKTTDPDAYTFHKTVGARILAVTDAAHSERINVSFLKVLPSAGMVYFPEFSDDDKATFPLCLAYFEKFKALADVQMLNHVLALYRVSMVYDVDGKCYVFQYAIGVTDDGSPILLRQRAPRQYVIQTRGKGKLSFQRMEWSFPEFLEWKHKDGSREKAEVFGPKTFCLMANFYDQSNEEFQVRAERGGVSLAFNVALGRTPYFFKDREIEVAADGRRKRIFHSVDQHARTLASGKKTIVKQHYRGLRQFEWSGESITITPPHNAMRSFDIAGIEDDGTVTDAIPIADAAIKIRRALEGASPNA